MRPHSVTWCRPHATFPFAAAWARPAVARRRPAGTGDGPAGRPEAAAPESMPQSILLRAGACRTALSLIRHRDVRFLGGARHARARLGRWPWNWRVAPFGALDVQDFLAGLDVFLHYPDPDYVEEFGRAPMEAMAAGVPVILPPEFAPTFGAGRALRPARRGLAAGRAALARPGVWEARAAAGRAFVAATAATTASRRLARLPAPRSRPGQRRRLFSVIVPVYRQWELVPALLDALAAQTLPAGRFEIDPGRQRAPARRARRSALPANARGSSPAAAPGSYAARNAGAAAAGGALLVFTDADCRPDPGWLAAIAAAAAARRRRRCSPGRCAGRPAAGPNRYEIYDMIRGIPQARYVAPRLRRHRQPGGAGGGLPRPRRVRRAPVLRRRRRLLPRAPAPPAIRSAWCPDAVVAASRPQPAGTSSPPRPGASRAARSAPAPPAPAARLDPAHADPAAARALRASSAPHPWPATGWPRSRGALPPLGGRARRDARLLAGGAPERR